MGLFDNNIERTFDIIDKSANFLQEAISEGQNSISKEDFSIIWKTIMLSLNINKITFEDNEYEKNVIRFGDNLMTIYFNYRNSPCEIKLERTLDNNLCLKLNDHMNYNYYGRYTMPCLSYLQFLKLFLANIHGFNKIPTCFKEEINILVDKDYFIEFEGIYHDFDKTTQSFIIWTIDFNKFKLYFSQKKNSFVTVFDYVYDIKIKNKETGKLIIY
jgi:hypothetical protein